MLGKTAGQDGGNELLDVGSSVDVGEEASGGLDSSLQVDVLGLEVDEILEETKMYADTCSASVLDGLDGLLDQGVGVVGAVSEDHEGAALGCVATAGLGNLLKRELDTTANEGAGTLVDTVDGGIGARGSTKWVKQPLITIASKVDDGHKVVGQELVVEPLGSHPAIAALQECK